MYNLHVHANPLTHIFILATVSCCDLIKSKSDSHQRLPDCFTP